ncbi:hypothetical protein LQF12_01650 [Ruania suaedae]|uniref:hypothetical protein n=1 Tax=Ruania suaedae TaxID=2897774 RepID=UPI001E4CAE7D|nr:hypothetical protein [Ruania suaedae]UFU03343.1 hypothetical protein LQF12_01650 [Ruania suaedae]
MSRTTALHEPRATGSARLFPSFRRAVLALLAAALTVLGAAAPGHAAPEPVTGADGPVVMIGVSGLAWSDIDPVTTPALASLTEEAVGSLVVRSVRSFTCPADGWLALSTGTRAADTAASSDDEGRCRFLLEPEGPQVRGWQDYTDALAGQNFQARPGLLAELLETGGVTTAGLGPGAAIALADEAGQVATHTERAGSDLGSWAAEAAADAQLLVIDAGSLREGEDGHTLATSRQTYREDQLQVIDARVEEIVAGLAQAPGEPAVLLAGVADSGYAPGLRVLALSGAQAEPGLLTSPSTRQDGFVLTTDLLPTLLRLLGVEDAGPTGSAIGAAAQQLPGSGGDSATERRDVLRDDALHADAVRPIVPVFYAGLVVLNLLLFAVVAVALKRPAVTRLRAWTAHRLVRLPGSQALRRVLAHPEAALGVLRAVALAIASIPVASYLANLAPWWRAGAPLPALLAITAAIAVLVVALALAGPWRRHLFGPVAVVAGLTALVLAVDVATGATLQLSAVMGVPTLVAGRFYGMNNTTFALFTTASLLVTIALTNPLVRTGRRRLAAVVTLAIGAAVVVLDGAPGLGADFGGPPALLPAFTVLALLALGVRLTWVRALMVLIGAGVATMAIAFVDWLRPDPTHLGRFFQTMLDGGLWDVIWRKLDQNISILFGNRPLTILAICGVLTVLFVLARPIRVALSSPGGGDFAWLSGGNPISLMGRQAPMLRPGLLALAIALGLGLAVNDSGIAIPALGVAHGVPLLIAACATWMLGLRDGRATDGVTSAAGTPRPPS